MAIALQLLLDSMEVKVSIRLLRWWVGPKVVSDRNLIPMAHVCALAAKCWPRNPGMFRLIFSLYSIEDLRSHSFSKASQNCRILPVDRSDSLITIFPLLSAVTKFCTRNCL